MSEALGKFYGGLPKSCRDPYQAVQNEIERWDESLQAIDDAAATVSAPPKNVFKPGANLSFRELPTTTRSPVVIEAANELAALMEGFLGFVW